MCLLLRKTSPVNCSWGQIISFTSLRVLRILISPAKSVRRLELVMFLRVPQEQSRNMEAIDEQKSQEEQSEGGPAGEKEGASRLWVSDVIINCHLFTLSAFRLLSGDVTHFRQQRHFERLQQVRRPVVLHM